MAAEFIPLELAEVLAQCHDIKFDNQAAMNAVAFQERQTAMAVVLERQRQTIDNMISGLKALTKTH